ncbi:MAG: four helix bundle protein [Bacteroidota bacterium]
MRRSSRSVCSNLAESHAKRRYPKHFTAKLTDALGENNETLAWLRFARRCQYLNNESYLSCATKNEEVGKLLSYMLRNPSKFGVRT